MIDIESDNMIKTETEKTTGLGARLRNAREAMSLSPKEAAAHLHLSVNIINIIENEQFSDGPPPMFMRGYLRSYARFLNVPAHEIGKTLQQLEITMPMTSTSLPILHTRSVDSSDRYLHWITYLVVFTMIVLVALWWHSHQSYVISDIPTKTTITPAATNAPIAAPETTQPAATSTDATQPATTTDNKSTITAPITAATIPTAEPITETNQNAATSAFTATTPEPVNQAPNTDASSVVTPLNSAISAPTATEPTTTPPPQVDTPPILSTPTSEIGLTESHIAPVMALPVTPAKPVQKHKRPAREGTLPGMPSINMALPEPG